jgi:hypothetical protein
MCMYPAKETDLAYLAGLIDGEGVVTIAKVRPAPRIKNGNPRYFAKVEIQMSDRPAIDHIARLYERHIMVKKPSANMKKEAYRVSWQAKIAGELLKQVLPYLVLKHPQALAVIAFQAVLTAEGPGGRPKTAEQIAVRERYYQELRRLKREDPGGLGC